MGAPALLDAPRASMGGELVAAAHLSFPGLGHIRAADKGYVWLPVNYSVP